jgi:hypothetical protein
MNAFQDYKATWLENFQAIESLAISSFLCSAQAGAHCNDINTSRASLAVSNETHFLSPYVIYTGYTSMPTI